MEEEVQVVLVNEHDEPQGTAGKLEAHRRGLLHRAISVFLFDNKGRMLLQRRALDKYHGGGLWSNACCSHPLPGEAPDAAAARRLQEELGISLPLRHLFSFTYRAEVENGLEEHEYDHVFAGTWEGNFAPDPKEVAGVRYVSAEELEAEIREHPERFTQWFRMIYEKVNRIREEKRF
ncbi:isopentenyl-diphosphate Delta-isomerase [Flaviaesturariibacter flavus]|uniref:Isopentenyl-diphosphate delta-isomerase n=1 Tax=Flaviaesturariibacter flavus TaxID=2502780 RepID=A0A4R1BB65_9BACT|nr:isopentenyl-diphosphate Delta-isomerase [Flaviaesturariibacter flavus]TCJ14203.1 isopentenyl-diphosphate Delta-isomerase [Flaviaesturariibacter flavus]